MSNYNYTILSGPDSSGDTDIDATAINASGQVTGHYTDSNGWQAGFIYDQATGRYITLSGPDSSGDSQIKPTGINAAGEVVGTYTNGSNAQLGFVYDPATGSYITLSGPDSSGDVLITPVGINDAGEVTGYYDNISSELVGFMYDPTTGSYTSFPDPGSATFIAPSGINASGEVSGFYENTSSVQYGFIYDPTTGSYIKLSGPDSSGDIYFYALAINASGEVTGNYTNSSGAQRGFIYDPTTRSYTIVYGPDGSEDSSVNPVGINASGEVTGDYDNTSSGATLGFIYDPATSSYAVLSGPDESGDFEIDPTGLNASGEVIGTYYDGDGALLSFMADPACYCPGTRIKTPDGEAMVETLTIGDSVITADGRCMPVRWIGRHTVSTRFADPLRVLPIRIKAGALGENLPERDLLVSADHAVLVDNILIQAGALVNGVSILRDRRGPPTLTYYHVELAEHALILAEGTPAETFVDHVSRMAFDNGSEHAALYGQAPIAEMAYPRAQSHRQVPPQIAARLKARSRRMMAQAAGGLSARPRVGSRVKRDGDHAHVSGP